MPHFQVPSTLGAAARVSQRSCQDARAYTQVLSQFWAWEVTVLASKTCLLEGTQKSENSSKS